MNKNIRFYLVAILLCVTQFSFAVHSVKPVKPSTQVVSDHMTVDQFLAIDPNQLKKSNGIRHAWLKRWALRNMQHRIKKKVDKKLLSGEDYVLKASKESEPNKRGKYALIFSGALLLSLFIGIGAFLFPFVIVPIILGFKGLRKDKNKTMAIIALILCALILFIVFYVVIDFANGPG